MELRHTPLIFQLLSPLERQHSISRTMHLLRWNAILAMRQRTVFQRTVWRFTNHLRATITSFFNPEVNAELPTYQPRQPC